MEDVEFIGKVFGRWTVIELAEDKSYGTCVKRYTMYKCKCVCGRIKLVRRCSLLGGASTSCGCYQKEIASKHGLTGTRVCRAYHNMLARISPKSKSRHLYYDKGITVCSRWADPELGLINFFKDMGDCPEGLELDRIDNSKGYFSDNCRWVSKRVQLENRGNYRNNSSGKKGVILVKKLSKKGCEYFYWQAYKATKGTKKTRAFSINLYGEEKAYELACLWRDNIDKQTGEIL